MKRILVITALIAFAGLVREVAAEETAEPQRVNVEGIKEKYWARGNETELGVVQNRLYSKEKKVQFSLLGGITASDPFLNIKLLGLSLGYHFNEYFSLHAVAWKAYSNPSSALTTFQQTVGATTNNNPQQRYYGLEAVGSIMYGKLSLVGKSIIYYDMHLMAGMGSMGTDNGAFFAGHVGLGQQFYINQMMSLSLDYRLMGYNETLIEKVITPKLGQVLGNRMNWSNTINFGINILIGGGGQKK